MIEGNLVSLFLLFIAIFLFLIFLELHSLDGTLLELLKKMLDDPRYSSLEDIMPDRFHAKRRSLRFSSRSSAWIRNRENASRHDGGDY